MKGKTAFLLSILLLLSFLSCNNKDKTNINSNNDTIFTIPITGEGTPHLTITLNDSIKLSAIFDTGSPLALAMSQYLLDSLSVNILKVRIGGIEQVVDTVVLIPKSVPMGRGKTVILGLEIFKDNIVEISWHDKCLRIIEDTCTLHDYVKIPFTIKSSAPGPIIPVTFYSQGKQFTLNELCVDTGLNGGYFIIRDDKVQNLELSTSNIYGTHISGTNTFKEFIIDSFAIHNLSDKNIKAYVIDKSIHKGLSDIDGLIGTSFLSKYNIAFDNKNQLMYLKAVDEL